MLIAHASSTCDVCLDTYSEGISYHSIPCGHVFCLSCLIATNPSRCPLCRHEFSVHNMRKLHFTLPSARDHFARQLEMKLVQTSPDMTLVESLNLFQEVQDWLEGNSEEEFLVLRAFAAVLCGFHEMKDKLSTTEQAFEESKTEANKREEELRRSLEEAQNTSNLHIDDYKSKYREAKAALSQLETETELLQSQLDQYKEREKQNQSTVDGIRTLYQTAKMEIMTLRDECTDFRSQIIKYQESEQKRVAEYREYYEKIQAHIQAQVQAQVQAQTQSIVKAAEVRAQARRESNPLPPPPKQVEIPFIKYMAKSTAARRASNPVNEREEGIKRPGPTRGPSPSKASSSKQTLDDDPMTSAFVPTLAGAYPSRGYGSNSDGHSEITTLVFKPPKRIPLWEDTSAEQSTAPARLTAGHQAASLRDNQRSGASQRRDDPSADEVSESIVTPTPNYPSLPSKASSRPRITYDEYVSYEDPPYIEKYPGWGGAGFVVPYTYNAHQEPASLSSRPSMRHSQTAPAQSPRRVSSPTVSRGVEWTDTQDPSRQARTRVQSHSHPIVEDAPAAAYDYYYDHHYTPPPPTVVRFRFPSHGSENDVGHDDRQAYSSSRDADYRYPNSRRIVVEEEEI